MVQGSGASRKAARRVFAATVTVALAFGLAACNLVPGQPGATPTSTSSVPAATSPSPGATTDDTAGSNIVGTLPAPPTTEPPTDVTPPPATDTPTATESPTVAASPNRPVPQYVKDRIAGVESQGYSECTPWWSDSAKYWVINCLDPYGRPFQLQVTP